MNHFKVSLFKSIIRIFVCILSCILALTDLLVFAVVMLCVGFGLAEILGIAEEIFDTRKEE